MCRVSLGVMKCSRLIVAMVVQSCEDTKNHEMYTLHGSVHGI